MTITGFDGKVEDIQTRATIINTSGGQRIVIPNAVLFTNPVVVHAAPKSAETNAAEAVPQQTGSTA
ncbi:MAG TPA: mechanosensitive ion channel domain-containing protein [Candidatus Acidoferrales bacterium]|nr:mechanosensitive ion channel domain-containing protein [Candidatus Acidoferrales bacterium]